MGDLFQWEFFTYFFPRVLESLPISIFITLISGFFATLLAILFAFIRIEKPPILNSLVKLFVSFFRGTSLYIQLFIFYFGLPQIFNSLGMTEIGSNPMASVLVAFTFNRTSYLTEIFRSAFLAVPKHQFEAAYTLGFNKYQTYLKFVIPQATRIALPNYGNSIISLAQDTSLAFTVGIIDMMGKVQILRSRTGRGFEGYISVAIIYILLSIIIEVSIKIYESKILNKLERKGSNDVQF